MAIGGLGIGAGANVVGGLMQSVAASMAKRAMEQAFAREILRQQRYRNKAFDVFQGTPEEYAPGGGEIYGDYGGQFYIDPDTGEKQLLRGATGVQSRGVETARKEIGQGAQNRQDFYGKVGVTKFGVGGGPDERDKALYGLLGKGRAQLGGYSDWALNRMIANIRTQDELNRISSFAGGEAGVFPLRMEEASHKGDELAFWGALISSLGGGAGSFLPQGGSSVAQYGSAFGGQGSPPNTGFGYPQGYWNQFGGQV